MNRYIVAKTAVFTAAAKESPKKNARASPGIFGASVSDVGTYYRPLGPIAAPSFHTHRRIGYSRVFREPCPGTNDRATLFFGRIPPGPNIWQRGNSQTNEQRVSIHVSEETSIENLLSIQTSAPGAGQNSTGILPKAGEPAPCFE